MDYDVRLMPWTPPAVPAPASATPAAGELPVEPTHALGLDAGPAATSWEASLAAASDATEGPLPWEAPGPAAPPSQGPAATPPREGAMELEAAVAAFLGLGGDPALAATVRAQLGDPASVLQLAGKNTCTAATAQRYLLDLSPARYFEFVTTLCSTGSATTPAGQVVTLSTENREHIAAEVAAGALTPTEAVNATVQAAFMDFANGDRRYLLSEDQSQSEGQEAGSGIDQAELARLTEALGGATVFSTRIVGLMAMRAMRGAEGARNPAPRSMAPTGGPTDPLGSVTANDVKFLAAQLTRQAEASFAKGEPVFLLMTEGNARHLVRLTAFDARTGTVTFDDPRTGRSVSTTLTDWLEAEFGHYGAQGSPSATNIGSGTNARATGAPVSRHRGPAPIPQPKPPAAPQVPPAGGRPPG